ncbi:MAG TPA: hypothetical protein VGH04_13085 [Gemmatimonadaceae bacterium]|jgi:hypothetical protein
MHWQNDGREETRGTILVASSHALFANIVGEMVTWCGFMPRYPLRREAPWLALTGKPPCVVICDCAAPADGIQRLIIDASARHIPLVLSDALMQQRLDDGSLILPQQVAWLTVPTSRDAFAAMLDALSTPPAEVVHRVIGWRGRQRRSATMVDTKRENQLATSRVFWRFEAWTRPTGKPNGPAELRDFVTTKDRPSPIQEHEIVACFRQHFGDFVEIRRRRSTREL